MINVPYKNVTYFSAYVKYVGKGMKHDKACCYVRGKNHYMTDVLSYRNNKRPDTVMQSFCYHLYITI